LYVPYTRCISSAHKGDITSVHPHSKLSGVFNFDTFWSDIILTLYEAKTDYGQLTNYSKNGSLYKQDWEVSSQVLLGCDVV